jgi:hypothetical protein
MKHNSGKSQLGGKRKIVAASSECLGEIKHDFMSEMMDELNL